MFVEQTALNDTVATLRAEGKSVSSSKDNITLRGKVYKGLLAIVKDLFFLVLGLLPFNTICCRYRCHHGGTGSKGIGIPIIILYLMLLL